MIAILTPRAQTPEASSLRDRAIAAVCARIERLPAESTAPELEALVQRARTEGTTHEGPDLLAELAAPLGLTELELLSASLASAVEHDMLLGRALARLQEPLGGTRPTLGLVASLFGACAGAEDNALASLVCGNAVASGLLTIAADPIPMSERTLSVPLPVYLALEGRDGVFAGTSIGLGDAQRVSLPASTLDEIERRARAFGSGADRALAIRCVSAPEARTVGHALGRALGHRVVFVEGEPPAGFGVWARLRDLIPVFVIDLAPGERKSIRAPLGYDGPIVALSGHDGTIELGGVRIPSFAPALPESGERARLWTDAIGDQPFIDDLARVHRHRPGRIAQIGRLARQAAAVRGAKTVAIDDIQEAAWTPEGPGLGALAESMSDAVADDALVTGDALRAELELLVLRCRARDGLAARLGPAARARYRTGVRALFVGPSGTGKTLAASWLATRLGIPMYRVDLASMTSKYIGETEKNLALMFERAEESEVIILFDEADSLFGKRTDVRDANDRFANAQTNYLLQRIESFDGIALLTSNSRQRIDQAFARRLDAVIEFPLPDAEERRRLWEAHLGMEHDLERVDVNRLAARVDLTGGQIRNAVLCAAAVCHAELRPMHYGDVVVGLAGEYRKLGRQMPRDLGAPWEGDRS